MIEWVSYSAFSLLQESSIGIRWNFPFLTNMHHVRLSLTKRFIKHICCNLQVDNPIVTSLVHIVTTFPLPCGTVQVLFYWTDCLVTFNPRCWVDAYLVPNSLIGGLLSVLQPDWLVGSPANKIVVSGGASLDAVQLWLLYSRAIVNQSTLNSINSPNGM